MWLLHRQLPLSTPVEGGHRLTAEQGAGGPQCPIGRGTTTASLSQHTDATLLAFYETTAPLVPRAPQTETHEQLSRCLGSTPLSESQLKQKPAQPRPGKP